MPVDDAFARYDMAILYDSFNRHGPDSDFYLALPQAPSNILDIGCGTGSLSLAFAERGHHVTGIEPADGMLTVARRNDHRGLVNWVAASGDAYDLDASFDLAIMTGHVFQVFLDDNEALAVLANARRHLATGGRLAFESRNPVARPWLEWTRKATLRRADVPSVGPVEVYYQVRDVEGEFVRFDAVFTVLETGEQRISESVLRFASQSSIADLLETAGFSAVSWLGDWDLSPFCPESPEIIAIASA